MSEERKKHRENVCVEMDQYIPHGTRSGKVNANSKSLIDDGLVGM